ncbi:hypothetical protein BKK49_01890 [Rodentibacter rarus]|uniref:Uncharacterized protein n=1 Tax=Rodentibacter rarus TaxID=1908260 RepID=A0A1V3IDF1_9PAST|nr:hypothetical protein [Rodentibacter rarus]OOF38422.1 hypothetical protein BKK50_11720 [Rodentibacter rarus]OOF42685.1 hypothetical protein BKK49_01890 [Rodentibacter rarus]
MTTIIHVDGDFLACDSKWSTIHGLDVNTPISKYLYVKDSIVCFAGSEFAIVCMQAVFKKLISINEYENLLNKQVRNGDSLDYIVVQVNNGKLQTHNLPLRNFLHNDILYLGSGGEFAAKFFYYAKKVKYKSIYGKNNVEGALNYAYFKDKQYSGKPTIIKSWNPKYPIDLTINNDNQIYDTIIYQRLKELNMLIHNVVANKKIAQQSLSHLSASLELAYKPNQHLVTNVSCNSSRMTPKRAEQILKDIKAFLKD